MTITIGVAVPEGIVIGADSRTTYGNARGWPKVGSDYAYKVFQLGERAAASTFGLAWLSEKNIASLMEAFKRTAEVPDDDPRGLAEALGQFFQQRYEEHVAAGYDKPVGAKAWALGFIVGAYDRASTGHLMRCLIPGPRVEEFYRTDLCGALWCGQTDIVVRLVKGRDPRFDLRSLPAKARESLEKMEYITRFDRFTLQDAVDYAIFLMKTTTEMQRFSDGVGAAPGDFAGTGGPLDIALVTPAGFSWIQNKKIRGETERPAMAPASFAVGVS